VSVPYHEYSMKGARPALQQSLLSMSRAWGLCDLPTDVIELIIQFAPPNVVFNALLTANTTLRRISMSERLWRRIARTLLPSAHSPVSGSWLKELWEMHKFTPTRVAVSLPGIGDENWMTTFSPSGKLLRKKVAWYSFLIFS